MLANLVNQLALTRKRTSEARQRLTDMEKAFTESPLYKLLKDDVKGAQAEEEQAEHALKEYGLQQYVAAGEGASKTLHPAVKVRENTAVVYEIEKAIAWARQNLEEAFKFDAKFFEKYAQAVADTKPVACVEIKKVPSIVIASDLTKYLEEGETETAP